MTTPPLPVRAITAEAYRILFGNFGTYLRLCWLPFLILFAVSTGMQFFYRDVAGLGEDGDIFLFAMGTSIEGSIWILTLPIATAWTRLVLQYSEQGTQLALGRAEWVYLLRYVCLYLLAAVAFALAFALPFLIEEWTGIDPDNIFPEESNEFIVSFLAAVFAPAAIFALFMISRFLPSLPAAAVGNASRLRDSFALTKGQMWALLAIMLLTLAPEAIGVAIPIAWGDDLELGPSDGIFWAAWIAIQYYAASWLFFPVSVGALALAYRHLGGMTGAAETPTSTA